MDDDLKTDRTLVLDIGSYKCMAGFAGDDAPRVVFPTVVARKKRDPNEYYVGDEAVVSKAAINCLHTFPVQQRVTTDWDGMEKVWRHIFFNELRQDPSRFHLLLTVPTLNPKVNEERTKQTMFEVFNVQSLCFMSQAVLALYASGNESGIVVDSGKEVTHIVPIHKGVALTSAVVCLEIGGVDVAACLLEHLVAPDNPCRQANAQVLNDADQRSRDAMVEHIKHDRCYVALDFEAEVAKFEKEADVDRDSSVSSSLMAQYEFPSGQKTTLGRERFMAPEVVFRPSMVGKDCSSIPEAIMQSLAKCNSQDEMMSTYLGNIVVAGGTTMFPGFAKRLSKEIRALATPAAGIPKVRDPPERKFSSWIGGSIIASLPNFRPPSTSKESYDAIPILLVNLETKTKDSVKIITCMYPSGETILKKKWPAGTDTIGSIKDAVLAEIQGDQPRSKVKLVQGVEVLDAADDCLLDAFGK